MSEESSAPRGKQAATAGDAVIKAKKLPPAKKPATDATRADLERTVATPETARAEAEAAAGEAPSAATQTPSRPGAQTQAAAGEVPSGAGQKAATTLGDYRLMKKLGQGGMGAVYKAEHTGTKDIVAVKVLAKELSGKPAFVQRFEREARVMTQLDHPNILRCFGSGSAGGYHYLAMEFVAGGSIEDHLKRLKRFEIGDALHIVLASARGLLHAHERSMVHRDVKPDNILLTKDGMVKVADLGLAKQTDDDMQLTKTGAGAGTPIYMAPEQARDVKHVDARCDIYALGCMLYVFLTGQQPFQGATLVELIEAKEKGKFTPIRRHNDEAPDRLDLIVDKMMAKKPEHRYTSCAEVIAEIEALGLASERLSFLESPDEKAEETPTPAAPTKLPAKRGAATQQPTTGKTTAPNNAAEPPGDYWYANLSANGRTILKKMTPRELETLIKTNSIDAQTQVSRDAKKGFRAVGTYPEFAGMVKQQQTKDKADKKGQKYRELYKDIEAADARRRRWGWLGRMFKNAGGRLMGVLWIALVLGAMVGAFFAVKYYFFR